MKRLRIALVSASALAVFAAAASASGQQRDQRLFEHYRSLGTHSRVQFSVPELTKPGTYRFVIRVASAASVFLTVWTFPGHSTRPSVTLVAAGPSGTQIRLIGRRLPYLSLAHVDSGGTSAIVGQIIRAPAGTRSVIDVEQRASLAYSLANAAVRIDHDWVLRRSANIVSAASGAVSVSADDQAVLVARGQAALVTLPCNGPLGGVARATLSGPKKRNTIHCPGQGDAVATALDTPRARWRLSGTWLGSSGAVPGLLLTTRVDRAAGK